MLARIALFELRYQVRRPIAWISFLIFGLLTFAIVASIGASGDLAIPLNSPGQIVAILASFGILAMFLTIATFADVALRDGNTRMDAILRVQPVRTSMHFGARFAGAYAVACMAFLGVAVGYVIATLMPWVPAAAAGTLRLEAYAMAILVIALPNLFATGALFYAVATLTRRLMATYLSAIVVLMVVVGTSFLLGHPAYRSYAAFADPFGLFAFFLDTMNWNMATRAGQMIPLDGLLMWNRLIWIGIGVLLLALSFTLSNARERRPHAARGDAPSAKASSVMLERPVIVAGGVSAWDQLVLRTRHETRSILSSWTFIALVILGILFAIGVLWIQLLVGMIPRPPVTLLVVNAIIATFVPLTLLIPIAYGGELIWRDRKAKIAQIVDATPAPTAVFLVSKIVATAFVILTLLGVGMATGIVFQLVEGSKSIDLALYLIKLTLIVGLPALMYSVLAVFIQTVVNQKFVGLLLMLAVLCVVGFADDLGIENPLLWLFSIPDAELPGTGVYLRFFTYPLSFAAYWSSIAVLIAVASYLIWVRGAGSLWTRIKNAPHAASPAVAMVAALAILGTAASAGYIHWSEHAMGYSQAPAVVAQN